MDEAFPGADIVYPKSWGPYDLMLRARRGQPAKDKARLGEIEKARARGQRAAQGLDLRRAAHGAHARQDALYMHPLPADIGDEVSHGVMEQHSVNVARQAQYKMYAIMALLAVAKVPTSPRGWKRSGSRPERGTTRGALDAKIASAAARDLPLAASILREAIRIPADHVDRPVGAGRRPALRHQQPRGSAPGVPAARHRRGRRRARTRTTSATTPSATWTGCWRTATTACRPREARRLPGRPRRHGPGAARRSGARRRGGIDPFHGLVDLARVDRAGPARAARLAAARRRVGAPGLRPRRRGPARRRGGADRRLAASCSSWHPRARCAASSCAATSPRPRRTTTAAARST